MKKEAAIKFISQLIQRGPKKITLNISREGDVVVEETQVKRYQREEDLPPPDE